MKQLFRFSILMFALLLPTIANARHDFEVDGIYYDRIGNDGVTVTCKGDYYSEYANEYTGDVIIPATVTYASTTYSVTAIDYGAFAECYGLKSVIIPNSVTYIGGRAFLKCYNLTSVTIGNSVTSIGWEAFNECSSLTSIDIPNSVTTIGNGAFQFCNGMTSVTIGNSVTTIGEYAFECCSGLTSVTIPNSVTSIGYYAFRSCRGLTSVEIPNSVTSIGQGAFSSCSGLTSIDIPNSVKFISDNVFNDCYNMMSVTIPNSVISIGQSAFSGCRGLTSVTIPNSVTTIGIWAFSGCTGLETLNFNADSCADFTSSHPFNGSNISTIIIGNNVKRIPAYFAKGLTKLTNVTIPISVTSIGDHAFEDCSGLETLDFNAESCADFGYQYPPFNGLNISIINIGDNVKRIPAYFAKGLTNLTSVTIGNSVISIGKEAFEDCSGLTSVTIGNSVKTVGDRVFSGCSELVTLYFNAESCADFGYPCQPFGQNISTIIIGDNVKRIPVNLASKSTNLTSVTIGKSVTEIGGYAFGACDALDTVKCLGTVPPVMTSSNCFLKTYNDEYPTTLLVPYNCYWKYQETDYWYKFSHIEEMDEVSGDVNGDGNINISDVTNLIDLLLSGDELPAYADVNGDGGVNIKDVTDLIDMLLSGN